jgi:hypothetical protein
VASQHEQRIYLRCAAAPKKSLPPAQPSILCLAPRPRRPACALGSFVRRRCLSCPRGKDGVAVGHGQGELKVGHNGTLLAAHTSCAHPPQFNFYNDLSTLAVFCAPSLVTDTLCCSSVRLAWLRSRWPAALPLCPGRAPTPQPHRATPPHRLGSEQRLTALSCRLHPPSPAEGRARSPSS